MPLLSQAHNSITQTLDTAVQNGAPGLVFHAIDKSGHTLISHATGTLGASTPSSMNASQTLFWIAACTKLITAIAVLQLVEQGKIPLDDEKWVGEIAPEIKAKEVFRAGKWGAGEEQKRGVTMSMLLSHTAGFAYRCIDVRCGDEEDEQGWLEGAGGDVNDILESRMVNQPGSAWEYGVSLPLFLYLSLLFRGKSKDIQCILILREQTIDQLRLGGHNPRARNQPNTRLLLPDPHLHPVRHYRRSRNILPLRLCSRNSCSKNAPARFHNRRTP